MVRSWIFNIFLGFAIGSAMVACTPAPEKSGQLTIQFPNGDFSSKVQSNYHLYQKGTGTTKWQQSDPSVTSAINCYIIAIGSEDSTLRGNRCYKVDDTTVGYVGIIKGAFSGGTTEVIEVPAGSARKIYLMGMHANSPSSCRAIESTAMGLPASDLSAPFILDVKSVDIDPGSEVTVNMVIPSNMSQVTKFEDCDPNQFSNVVGVAPLTITSITPNSRHISGGHPVTIVGTGFDSTVTVDIGGAPCVVTANTSTSLTCTVGSNSAGTYSVALARSDLQTASLPSAFTYNPPPGLYVSDLSVTEGTSASVTVSLSAVTDDPVTFSYATSNNTATSAIDYTALSGTGTIPAGSISTTITFNAVEDSLYETSETADFTISGPSSNANIVDGVGVVTITDNESVPMVDFAAASQIVYENVGGSVTVSAQLGAISGLNVDVTYAVTGTAVFSSDHDLASGTLTVPAGSLGANLSINLVNDSTLEGIETIVITLSAPINGTLGATTVHTVTVKDDEQPSISVSALPNNPSNLTTLAINVDGGDAYTNNYKYDVLNGTDCSVAAYGSLTSMATNITADISPLTDGLVTICIVGISDSGVVQSTEYSFTWYKDTSPPSMPSSIALSTPGSSPGNVNTPSVNISGVNAGDTVYFYSDSTCTTAKGNALAGATSVTVSAGSALADGAYTFYANSIDSAGNQSPCSSASVSYLLDTVQPTTPGSLSGSPIGISPYFSPPFNWTPSIDTSSGVAAYEYAVGTTPGAWDVQFWTDIGLFNSFFAFNSFTDGTSYYFVVRARDNAGNFSFSTNRGWTIDETPAHLQQAYVKSDNIEANDKFGSNVAIDGDFMVVGSSLEDSNLTGVTNGAGSSADNSATESGAVYVFKRTGSSWTQVAYLKATNAEPGDQFGSSVAISGDTIVVGAALEDSNQSGPSPSASGNNSVLSSGAAYVFRFNGTIWIEEAYLKPPNPDAGDFFGTSVAISRDTIIVGSQSEDSNQTTITNGATASADNSAANSGAAYIFKRNGVTWAQEAYLKAPNSGAGDAFGFSVSIDKDTAIVGAYNEQSNQTTITNGTTASANNSLAAAGAAYIFKRTGTTWAQEAYLKAPNAGISDQFGTSVAIHGETAVVGAFGEASNQNYITNGVTASADNSLGTAGAVYVFQRSGSAWAQEAYIKPTNPDANDSFGSTVSIFGSSIVVGAHGESSCDVAPSYGATATLTNGCGAAGALYLFQRSGTTWSQAAYLKAPNSEASDRLGKNGVSISGSTIVSSSVFESGSIPGITNGSTASGDNSAFNAGAVYVFEP